MKSCFICGAEYEFGEMGMGEQVHLALKHGLIPPERVQGRNPNDVWVKILDRGQDSGITRHTRHMRFGESVAPARGRSGQCIDGHPRRCGAEASRGPYCPMHG